MRETLKLRGYGLGRGSRKLGRRIGREIGAAAAWPFRLAFRVATGLALALLRVTVALSVIGAVGLGVFYFFFAEFDADGNIVVPERPGSATTSTPGIVRVPRARPAYDREAEIRRIDERVAFQRRQLEGQLARKAARGASDEELAQYRRLAEQGIAANEAGRRAMEARRAREILGEAAAGAEAPDPVGDLRSRIERRREKRAAQWARWLEGFEGENLALERAYVERREAEDREREDRELAELEDTMRRRGLQSGP